MRKLFFILMTCVLTFGILTVACTKTSGPPRPESKLRLVAQTHGPAQKGSAQKGSAQNQEPSSKPAEPEVGQDAPEATPDRDNRGLRFAVISDLNSSYGSVNYGDEVHEAVAWLVDEVQPDVVLSTGDMVAGQRKGLDYEAMWKGFHAAVTRPLSQADIPLMVTPGNHDASAGSVYMHERVTFVEQWKRHQPKVRFIDDSFYPLYYAFEVGPALFISLDATITGPLDAEQHRWLRKVLSEHEHKKAKVVFGHVPNHPFSEERKTEVLADDELESVLVEFGVDLMISGHHHAYYPGRRDKLRMVGMACLGSGPRTLIGATQRSKKSVAVIDISPSGEISVEAYDALDYAKIERDTLPEHLNSGRQRIWRDDVESKTTN
jgi:hypothetical protein